MWVFATATTTVYRIRPRPRLSRRRLSDRADTQQVLASILRTAHQRGLDATEVLTTLLRAPKPIVSPQFYPTAVSVD